MNGTIKAIETRYKGYRFRSRLEARWAVFFDALDMEWVYEPEGFDLGDLGWYLPDFYIRSLNVWVEIKPQGFADDAASMKCHTLRAKGQRTVWLCIGNPYPDEHVIHVFHKAGQYVYGNLYERINIFGDFVTEISEGDFSYTLYRCENRILQNAFDAARGARFEHGENGAAR